MRGAAEEVSLEGENVEMVYSPARSLRTNVVRYYKPTENGVGAVTLDQKCDVGHPYARRNCHNHPVCIPNGDSECLHEGLIDEDRKVREERTRAVTLITMQR